MTRRVRRKPTFKSLRDKIGERVGNKARANLARNTLPHSKTIAGSLGVLHRYRQGVQKVLVRSPYHFAAILDRGRKKPANGTLQVWFLNALRDDPRLKYGYTRRRGMRPRLTKAEFLKWKRINASYPEGQKPMVIAKVTSRTKNVRGKYFQGRNTAAVHRATAKIVDEEVKRFIDDSLVYRTQDHGLVGGKRVEIEI